MRINEAAFYTTISHAELLRRQADDLVDITQRLSTELYRLQTEIYSLLEKENDRNES